MGLEAYRQKRDFRRTAEPKGRKGKANGHRFVVQKHAARRLHYDFRLELDGVFLSWAVPKGPSLDPNVKRLAMQVEDHPLDYGDFEGGIPKGQYGGGTVLLWDSGSWHPDGDPREMVDRGRLTFELKGEKLHGSFHLVRADAKPSGSTSEIGRRWLLMKRHDGAAQPGSDAALLEERPESVATGLGLDAIAKDPPHLWTSKETAHAKRGRPKVSLPPLLLPGSKAKISGARRAKLPVFVEPELATLVKSAPEGDDWLHEIKLDGYRIVARVEGGQVQLGSRRGHDWTSRLPSIASAFGAFPVANVILDGEVVVLRDDGVSDFQRLQNSLEAGRDASCVYFVFDAPFMNGFDLRALPLAERKALLKAALDGLDNPRVRLSAHVVGDGPAFFGRACELGLEGIISKRAKAPYTSGRGRSWLKVKCLLRQEFVIGGYTEPGGARSHLGALLLGVREHGALVYAGKVGTGFTRASLAELSRRLAPLGRAKSPFANPPRGADARGVHWVAPRLVAEVSFVERTDDGLIRHGSFQGLRDDKATADVHAERAEQPAKSGARPSAAKPSAAKSRRKTPARIASTSLELDLSRFEITHPNRVLYPDRGIQKRDLMLHYARVAHWMLPHVIDRPLMLLRCPEGAGKTCFHQKHPSAGMPKSVQQVNVPEKKATKPNLIIRDVDGLFGLVQMGGLEIHSWGCRAVALECPDQLVFDLDPDEGLSWERITEAALRLRAELREFGLTGFPRSTGGKGLHVVVPVTPTTRFDEAKQFSKRVVEALVKAEPAKYVATMAKRQRAGKIFLDYFRNGLGATAICSYSTRARPGAPVATPILWDELERDVRGAHFNVENLPQRLAALKRDPWDGFDTARIPIPTRR